LLGGMCEGGIVALEIALQLQAQALEVALLAEFDTPVNGYWRKRPVDWVRHGWSLIRSRRLVPRTRDHIRARMTSHPPPTPEEAIYAHIVNVTWEAIRKYRPKSPFDGEIHLFRSPRSPSWHVEDVGAGWDARASLGIRVHDVVGEHVGMFSEPVSQRIIADVIAQAHRHPTAK
jgi:thioesterase domain-containing protein